MMCDRGLQPFIGILTNDIETEIRVFLLQKRPDLAEKPKQALYVGLPSQEADIHQFFRGIFVAQLG